MGPGSSSQLRAGLFLIWGLPFLVLASLAAHSFVHQTLIQRPRAACLSPCACVRACACVRDGSPSFCLSSVISLPHSVLSLLLGLCLLAFLKTFARPLSSTSYTVRLGFLCHSLRCFDSVPSSLWALDVSVLLLGSVPPFRGLPPLPPTPPPLL